MNCVVCGQALLHDKSVACEVCREKALGQIAELLGEIGVLKGTFTVKAPESMRDVLETGDPHPCDPITLAGRDFDAAVDKLGLGPTWGRK